MPELLDEITIARSSDEPKKLLAAYKKAANRPESRVRQDAIPNFV